MIWLKFVHITMIAIWSAGLICLPGLYLQRAQVADKPSLHRLQAFVRYLYVGIVSPAAFLAVGTGTVLIFLRETFEPWFTVKLYLVGLMALLHVLTGLVVIRLFEEGQVYPLWRFLAVTVATFVIILLILFVVLAKPDIPDLLPAGVDEPGALRRFAIDLIPFLRR
jgi:protoporphyrinogen IX oxidase